jgi:DNA-damage-inducible protein D
MNTLDKYKKNIFEDIKHIDEYDNEYWLARELQIVLGYNQWRSVSDLIKRAKIACKESNHAVKDHFAVQRKMIKIAKGAERKVIDYRLSRYACYLIVMNGNPKKEIIALGQTYFAIQTRKQELLEDELKNLSEDNKRVIIRKQVKEGNLGLNRTAVNSGVKNMAEFHNAGYKGLYNGETANDIAKRKELNYRQDILDFMGSEELAANLFRITQTDSKLKRDEVDNEYDANSIHYNVGKEVRNSIKRMGGNMPEDLPTPKSSVKHIDKNDIKKK